MIKSYDSSTKIIILVAGPTGLGAAYHLKKCWMYSTEKNSPFYWVTNFHNYSPFNVPGGNTDCYSSLMCETTYSNHKPEDKATIIDTTIQGLINSGMIVEVLTERIVSRYLIDIPYSYPVPTLGCDKALSVIQPCLEARDIYSRGRFGAWKYGVGNMDHSFMQGVELIERLFAAGDEPTLKGRVLWLAGFRCSKQ